MAVAIYTSRWLTNQADTWLVYYGESFLWGRELLGATDNGIMSGIINAI